MRRDNNELAIACTFYVETVTPRMKVTCKGCGETPKVGTERLVSVYGSGRWQKQNIYCPQCGGEKLRKVVRTIGRMKNALGYKEES